MKVRCHAPLCGQYTFMTMYIYFTEYWVKGKRWCCPACTERMNPSNPKYDDGDPNTNPDLEGTR